MYKENPKTKGSGIICCIPQRGKCPVGCANCFFQSGRSYLEPLEDNLPNMPSLEEVGNKVVRVNDGNDSNNDFNKVLKDTTHYPLKFYNTSMNKNIRKFNAPVVLTVNPSNMTDDDFHWIKVIPSNLMFVRFRINTWNDNPIDNIYIKDIGLATKCINYYTSRNVPVVLTFMAYYDKSVIPIINRPDYIYRKRTTNSYYAITTSAWEYVMDRYKYNHLVYSCGKIEGELGTTKCSRCGNCLREYFNTIERMK